ncbi:MAG: hypothetical protein FDZ75_08125 [Actinobacteria bacterium]|nr:MAG: hypothetical protein FDZ75_08125 [Actinomycetota bacterium]
MSTLARFDIEGPAEPGKVRAAGIVDFVLSAVVAMLVMPQPFIRSSLMSSGATPASIATFVAVLLGGIFLVQFLYVAFFALKWGRTYPMYLFGLGLDAPTPPTMREAGGFAFGWLLAALPAVFGVRAAYDGERGWPARLGGVPTRAVRHDEAA